MIFFKEIFFSLNYIVDTYQYQPDKDYFVFQDAPSKTQFPKSLVLMPKYKN